MLSFPSWWYNLSKREIASPFGKKWFHQQDTPLCTIHHYANAILSNLTQMIPSYGRGNDVTSLWRHFPMTSWTRHEHTPLSNPRTLIYAPFCIRPSMEAPLYNYLRSLTRSFWLQEIQIYLRFHLALFLNIPNYWFIYFLLLILFLFLVKVNLNFVGFLLLVSETKFYVSFHAAVITLLIK